MTALAGLVLNGAACELGHSCTDIGCGNGVAMVVHPESHTWREGTYTVEIALDDDLRSCRFSVPEDLPATGATSSFECGLLEQLAECNEVRNGDAVSQSCELVPGAYRLVLNTYGEPANLGVSVARDGDTLLSHEQTLRYTESRPNGPECGPVCRWASVELTFDE